LIIWRNLRFRNICQVFHTGESIRQCPTEAGVVPALGTLCSLAGGRHVINHNLEYN